MVQEILVVERLTLSTGGDVCSAGGYDVAIGCSRQRHFTDFFSLWHLHRVAPGFSSVAAGSQEVVLMAVG